MIDINGLRQRISADLGLTTPFVKGQNTPVRNCWHFSSDGNYIDCIFFDEEDFIDAMNRIYVLVRSYDILILAFCLMDNHVHFLLYGDFKQCNLFMHEYMRRTSIHIANRHGERHKLKKVPIDYQVVGDDAYLKTAICYIVKNPPVAGLPFTAYDYPWSSGALYMRNNACQVRNSGIETTWTSPSWIRDDVFSSLSDFSGNQIKEIFKTNEQIRQPIKMIGRMIFPGEYVAWPLVNAIFKTQKSYNYFMSTSRESDVESRGGSISRLSIPDQEMRQNKASVCRELFGVETVRTLSTQQRLRLLKVLKHRYDSSPKQLARICGLRYDEIQEMI